MARLRGHRQTKETATDKPNLMLPRHISTLPILLKNSKMDPLQFLAKLNRERQFAL
jgi:hypothetical protein